MTKSLRSKTRLRLTKSHSYLFSTYGEITKLLYSNQLLIRMGKGFEHRTIKTFVDIVEPNDIVFDVGANIGMYSLLSSDLLGEKGKVYSFEPVAKTFEAFATNVRINLKSNVITNKLALSNENGTAEIKVPEMVSADSDAFSSLNFGKKGGGEVIETMTLDSFVKTNEITKIDFIKVDIEGAELLFFQGAIETLKTLKPRTIVFEAYEPFCARFNYTVADLIILLSGLGYKLKQYDDWQWIATRNNNL